MVDRAPEGREGPWITYARMPNLRSWKDQTGPDLGVPSLTYQAWHEARFGTASWDRLTLIPKEWWNDYLLWFRRVAGVPVRNGVEAGRIEPATTDDGLPCLRVETSAGAMLARKVVLATGQEDAGRWWMPDSPRGSSKLNYASSIWRDGSCAPDEFSGGLSPLFSSALRYPGGNRTALGKPYEH